MLRFLRPGLSVKRWLLSVLFGSLFLLLFIVLAFGDEIQLAMGIIGRQLSALFQLSPQQYGGKLIAEILFFAVGLFLLVLGGKRLIAFLINALLPEKKGKIAALLSKSMNLGNAPNVVVIGGGTGLNSLLRGLKEHTNAITAIVSVADEGSHSRKIRNEFGLLPPGDIRNCIVALSDSGPLMAKLLEYRFSEGKELKGHNVGNLLIAALSRITGSFEKGVEETGKILAIRGRVLPVSLGTTHLCAELENGKLIREEPNVEEHKTKHQSEIKRLFLDPAVQAYKPSLDAIKDADVIVIGPGSLYTSILPLRL
ncbi:YvcK family protein [Candidatus Woesearchaeota archaeon]|nr:YvcK family protein [Candidatus Woesearchaeota archaeon]